jgi:signal transduction histidine kinase
VNVRNEPVNYPSAMRVLSQRFVAEEVRAVLRHELTGKLGAMRLFVHSLKRRLQNTTASADADVGEAVQMLESTVTSALGALATKTETLDHEDVEPVDATALVGDLVVTLGIDDRVRVAGRGAAWVRADRRELELALACLVENALEASRERTEIHYERVDDQVVIEIVDDGPGVVLPDEPDPFFSSKPGRSGTGLRIARRVARRWAGRLDVERRADATHVILRLPAHLPDTE